MDSADRPALLQKVPAALRGMVKLLWQGYDVAVSQGQNPFADLYRRWIDQGLSSKLARR